MDLDGHPKPQQNTMSSQQSHKIKGRKTANDVFLTPPELVQKQIDMIPDTFKERFGCYGHFWVDPFYGTGNYFNNYPETVEKDFFEIAEPHNKDFFKQDPDEYETVDVICSNPPYSMITPVLKKCVDFDPDVISLLIGQGNLTTKRIEFMNQNGYGLTKVLMVKISEWYGFSYIVQFEKMDEITNVIEIDRKIYHDENAKKKK